MDPVALANILETLMLLGFASAWPFNIVRAYRARTALGTSLGFMVVIEFAYICGMLSKIAADNVTYVFAFYVLDFSLVAIAMAIYFRNRSIDKLKGRGQRGRRTLPSPASLERMMLRYQKLRVRPDRRRWGHFIYALMPCGQRWKPLRS